MAVVHTSTAGASRQASTRRETSALRAASPLSPYGYAPYSAWRFR
jgi:hypothetical protein